MMKYTVFLLALVALSCASAGLTQSKYYLDLDDSVSSIPISDFQLFPDLNDDLRATVEGAFNAEFIETPETHLVVTGYENFYATEEDVFPLSVIYSTVGDQLIETSRIPCRKDVQLTNTAVSPSSDRKYVVSSTTQSTYGTNPFTSQIYLLEIYSYDDNGVFNPVPEIINQYDLDPLFWGFTVAYNGVSGVSHDGKYIVVTYITIDYATFSMDIQKHAIIDRDTLTKVAEIETAPTNIDKINSFPQGLTMWQEGDDYHLIIAENSWNLTNPVGLTSQMCYYTFTPSTGAFDRHDCDLVPQYIQGYNVDLSNDMVHAVTNQVDPTGEPTVRQGPRSPYDNSAVDSGSELRMWKLNRSTKTLTYVGGDDLGADGIEVRSSPDGKLLAVVTAPSLYNDFFETDANPLSQTGLRYNTNVVTLYSVKDGKKLSIQDSKQASPLSFGLTFSADSKSLFVAGSPSYSSSRGSIVGEKNNQLYTIRKK